MEFRRYPRVQIPQEKSIQCEGVDTELHGEVAVLGLGGLLIRTPIVYPRGTVFGVRIRDGECEVEAICAVRSVDPGGLGVEFVQLRGENEENLKSILQRLGA